MKCILSRTITSYFCVLSLNLNLKFLGVQTDKYLHSLILPIIHFIYSFSIYIKDLRIKVSYCLYFNGSFLCDNILHYIWCVQ